MRPHSSETTFLAGPSRLDGAAVVLDVIGPTAAVDDGPGGASAASSVVPQAVSSERGRGEQGGEGRRALGVSSVVRWSTVIRDWRCVCWPTGRVCTRPVASSTVDVDADAVGLGEGVGGEHLVRAAGAATAPWCSSTTWSATAAAWSRSCRTTPTATPWSSARSRTRSSDLHLVAQVEVRGGLVEQQDAGVLREAGGEPDPLQLAAGQLVDAAVGHRCDAGDVHRAGDGARAVGVVRRRAGRGTGAGRTPTTSRTLTPDGVGRDWESSVTRRAKSFADRACASAPSARRPSPPSGVCSRASARSSVDLPEPLGPMSAVTCPGRRRRSAEVTTTVPW